LPDFYSAWGESEGSRSANHVAKEIINLKKENIDGLILDVRFNGGGSLAEAVAMAGIFIDAGPVGIEKSRDKEPVTIKDFNRGTIYDGPLILLVNGMSASASEFLASTMHDYKRAIIVGSTTFGKGIAQEMFPLEPGITEMNFRAISSNKPWGYATVTTSKMYGINGKSVQRLGVTPDIVLPDYYELYEYREEFMPTSLKADSILKKTYYQPFQLLSLIELNEKSTSRVSSSENFKAIEEFVEFVKEESRNPAKDFTWTVAKEQSKKYLVQSKSLAAALEQKVSAYTPVNHIVDTKRAESDDYIKKTNDEWISRLLKDIYVEESYLIMCDYLETLKSKIK
jgi:carboxyl-terminal processing protease